MPGAFLARGAAFEQKREFEKAKADYLKAKEVGASFPQVVDSADRALENLKRLIEESDPEF